MKMMLKKASDSAFDHLKQLRVEMSNWKPVSKTRNGLMIQEQFSSPNDYQKWLRKYDSKTNCSKITNIIDSWPRKPLISIVLPVYNIDINLLKKTLDSVIFQLYDNWELCIVDDASSKINIKNTLQQYANKDKRIKLNFRKKNGHISAASNDALKLVNGDYVALLDHDDILSKTALFG